MEAVHRGRPKSEPDPQIRAAIIEAALAIVHEEGIDAFGISHVLDRTKLSTRAFYRHFDSKDKLVTAMFAEIARVETERLKEKMADQNPVGAVVAWIDGRLGFGVRQEGRVRLPAIVDRGAHADFSSPELVSPAYGEILRPLIDQIILGKRLGLFVAGHPFEEAMSIHGVVWANVERQWASGALRPRRRTDARSTLLPARPGCRRRRHRRDDLRQRIYCTAIKTVRGRTWISG